MKRTIIEINEDKCVGCGLCAGACEQGAIQMINGKAKLVSDSYCDGLGKCLPSCPVDAIELTEKEVDKFDDERKGFALKDGEKSSGCGSTKEIVFNVSDKPIGFGTITSKPASEGDSACGCGSAHEKAFKPNSALSVSANSDGIALSQLKQWPIQINLVNSQASFLQGADLLIAADCTAYAYANFHEEFIKGKVTLIGCPKLDNLDGYIEKFTDIFARNKINSITVVRLSVPCCGGITTGVKKALELSGQAIPYLERTITPDGKIL